MLKQANWFKVVFAAVGAFGSNDTYLERTRERLSLEGRTVAQLEEARKTMSVVVDFSEDSCISGGECQSGKKVTKIYYQILGAEYYERVKGADECD